MAKIDIWMPFYVGDYLSSTTNLQTPQHGAYVLLMIEQWKKARPLPNDLDQLIQVTRLRPFFVDASSITESSLLQVASIPGSSTSEELRLMRAWVLDLLKEYFVQQPGGGWLNLRGAKERVKWAERQEAFHNRGKAGAAGRWGPGYVPKRKRPAQSGDASSTDNAKPKQSPSPSPVRSKNLRDFVPSSGRNAGPGSPAGRSSSPKPTAPRSAAALGHPPKKPAQASAGPPNGARGATKPVEAVSTPRKSVASVPKTGVRPSKPERRPDVRFGSFKSEIEKYWRQTNRAAIAARSVPADPPWGTRERVELNMLLSSNPSLDLRMFARLLQSRAGSEAIVYTAPPYKWIKDLLLYAGGSLDQYKKPLRR